MERLSQSDSFKINLTLLKIFGVSRDESSSKYYKCYSFFYISFLLVAYNAILTGNFFYIPLKGELIIEEVIFYFNEVTIMVKVATILFYRKQILAVFEILDCEAFYGNDAFGREIIANDIRRYKTVFKLYAMLCNLAFFLGSIFPVLSNIVLENFEWKLPVSRYHFLSNETRENCFGYLYFYQDLGLYGQMMYNVNIDSIFSGLLFYTITQMKVLGHELKSLQWKQQNARVTQEEQTIHKFNYCQLHYESILKYCEGVQRIISVALFFEFGMASIIICVILLSCAVLLPDAEVFSMTSYLACMMVQIFVPAWLGTQLTYESQKLVFAAYSSEWGPRSKRFKSSVNLFMERANTPIVMSGMNLFILNLENFVAIMKTAYSFLTLVRNVQENN